MQFAPLRQRNFALLWWAGLISIAGDWTLRIALPIFVLQLTGSALATSGAVIATMAPVLFVGLIAGVYVDRWDRRKVLVVVSLAQAAALLPLLLADSAAKLWIVYAVLFVQSALSQFFMPAENALLPSLVAAEQLPVANSLNALNNNIARLAGPAIGGLLAAAIGLSGIVLVDALSFLLAAALVAGIRGSYSVARDTSMRRPGVRRELAECLNVIGASPMAKVLLVITGIIAIGEGVMGGLFAVFVTRPLHGGARELGWTMSAQAIGGVLGGLAGAPIVARIAPERLLGWAMVAFGLLDIAIFNYPRWTGVLWPGLVPFVVVGIPAALGGATWMTLLQRTMDDAYLGRVFSVALVVESVAGLLGATLGGTLAGKLGVLNLLTIQGALPLLCGIGFAIFIRGRVAGRHSPAVVSPEMATARESS